MPTNILMPALSPTMEKGDLAKWLKKEGDAVQTGDVIAEIETDKATMEYKAIKDGRWPRSLLPEGTQDVAVDSVIAVLQARARKSKRRRVRRNRGRHTKAPEKKPRHPPPARLAAALPKREGYRPPQSPVPPHAMGRVARASRAGGMQPSHADRSSRLRWPPAGQRRRH